MSQTVILRIFKGGKTMVGVAPVSYTHLPEDDHRLFSGRNVV